MGIIEIVGAMVGSGALTGFITAIVSRRKATAEAEQIETTSKLDIAKSAMEYADRIEHSFSNRIDYLVKEVQALKEENILLRQKIDILVDENIKLRLEIGKLSMQGSSTTTTTRGAQDV